MNIESFKYKIIGSLGFLGVILYQPFHYIWCIFPLLYIDMNVILFLVIAAITCFVPYANIVIKPVAWIWAGITVIKAPISFISILFFVVLILQIIYVVATIKQNQR